MISGADDASLAIAGARPRDHRSGGACVAGRAHGTGLFVGHVPAPPHERLAAGQRGYASSIRNADRRTVAGLAGCVGCSAGAVGRHRAWGWRIRSLSGHLAVVALFLRASLTRRHRSSCSRKEAGSLREILSTTPALSRSSSASPRADPDLLYIHHLHAEISHQHRARNDAPRTS